MKLVYPWARHVAGDEGERADERAEVMRGRGILHVTLGKVVNPRMELGDLHDGADTYPPDIVGEIDGRKLGKIKKCNTTYST